MEEAEVEREEEKSDKPDDDIAEVQCRHQR